MRNSEKPSTPTAPASVDGGPLVGVLHPVPQRDRRDDRGAGHDARCTRVRTTVGERPCTSETIVSSSEAADASG